MAESYEDYELVSFFHKILYNNPYPHGREFMCMRPLFSFSSLRTMRCSNKLIVLNAKTTHEIL